MSLENLPEFLTVKEAAEVCRVDRKTIYRLVWSGRIAVSRVGRIIRIPRAEIVRLLGTEPHAA